MPISDAQYLAWLRADNKSRVVLVEAKAYSGGAEVTRYFSNLGYVSAAADTPASTLYEDWLITIPEFSNSMSEQFSGQSTPSWGDADIANENGARDSWLNDGWDGRDLKLLLGDPAWPRSDFRTILAGTTADIYAKDRSTLSLRIRDKQWRLNVPAQTNLIGGTTANKDLPKPLCYGQCFNVEPVLIDAALHKYQFHDGAVNAVTTVYDNGISVGFTADIATGTFVLLTAPYGRITADVQGAKPSGTYLVKCADIMSHLITTHTTLTSADLDSASFTAFNTTCPQALGLYVRERENLIPVLDSLIVSVGGWYGPSRAGLFQLGRLEDPSAGTSVLDLVADELVEGELRSTKRQIPKTIVRLGYRKNWTVMQDGVNGVGGIAGAVTEERRAELAEEYLVAKAEDAAILTAHLLASKPELEGTLLTVEADAVAEAARRLALYGVTRQVFLANAFSAPYQVNLGSVVQLTHPRYGFSAGLKAQVVKLTEQPVQNRLMLELWR